MPVPLAGGEGHKSLLSECGPCLLAFFTMASALPLRLVCREFMAAVREQDWEDSSTPIHGSLAAWRASFPHARCANVQHSGNMWAMFNPLKQRATPLVDADLVHFKGIRVLNLMGQEGLTGAGFEHLRGIQELNLCLCKGVQSAGLAHLGGIQKLNLEWCAQLTDAAFEHLDGIQELNMSTCSGITGAAFVHLRGIQKLRMQQCCQESIGDAALAHIRGVQELDMGSCWQESITDAGLAQLAGVKKLSMGNCWQESITDAALAPLGRAGLQELHLAAPDVPLRFTDAAFVELGGLKKLSMIFCRSPALTDAALAGLLELVELDLMGCTQLNGSTLGALRKLEFLEVQGCSLALICAAGAAGLPMGDEEMERYWEAVGYLDDEEESEGEGGDTGAEAPLA